MCVGVGGRGNSRSQGSADEKGGGGDGKREEAVGAVGDLDVEHQEP